MFHKKAMHIEKVSSCWHFSNGLCTYGDERCWFSHMESQSPLDKPQLECNICDKAFTKRTDVMKHKKTEHPKSVQTCKLFKKGNCTYLDNCWFLHENQWLYNDEHEKLKIWNKWNNMGRSMKIWK